MSDLHLVKGVSIPDEGEPAEGKQLFKVAIISIAAELRTVLAEDAQEAVALCTEKNLGRHAGRQGPQVISIAATDAAKTPETPDYLQMTVDQLMNAGAQKARENMGMIATPNIVLPPGFNPKGPA